MSSLTLEHSKRVASQYLVLRPGYRIVMRRGLSALEVRFMCRCLYQDAACTYDEGINKLRSLGVMNGDMFPLAYHWPEACTSTAHLDYSGIFRHRCDVNLVDRYPLPLKLALARNGSISLENAVCGRDFDSKYPPSDDNASAADSDLLVIHEVVMLMRDNGCVRNPTLKQIDVLERHGYVYEECTECFHSVNDRSRLGQARVRLFDWLFVPDRSWLFTTAYDLKANVRPVESQVNRIAYEPLTSLEKAMTIAALFIFSVAGLIYMEPPRTRD